MIYLLHNSYLICNDQKNEIVLSEWNLKYTALLCCCFNVLEQSHLAWHKSKYTYTKHIHESEHAPARQLLVLLLLHAAAIRWYSLIKLAIHSQRKPHFCLNMSCLCLHITYRLRRLLFFFVCCLWNKRKKEKKNRYFLLSSFILLIILTWQNSSRMCVNRRGNSIFQHKI